jgi:hypothetical protein
MYYCSVKTTLFYNYRFLPMKQAFCNSIEKLTSFGFNIEVTYAFLSALCFGNIGVKLV